MKQKLGHKTYRRDVDGLRAIAVLSVVMFHYGIGSIRGGFAGVDVFYVISGYLITGIIHKEIARNEFTFAGFYERRVRRIFPALFAMLLTVMAAGPLVLLPSDLNRLGGAGIATLLFASNVLFWRQSGYFDPSAQLNPLLHTWSLAVEEQFYIGFPILMLLIERFARRRIVLILIYCALVSFALCLYFQPLRPAMTFYLFPFRAWELMLGALLAVEAVPLVTHRVVREVIAGFALAVLVASLLLLPDGPSYPGWQAAFPVVATAVLLHSGASGESLAGRILALRPMALVGLISYSLYLWHWPLMVYVRYRQGMEPLSSVQAVVLFAAAILIAWASYRWVETPFRSRGERAIFPKRRALFQSGMAAVATLAVCSAIAMADNGWQSRVPADVAALDQEREPSIPYQFCEGMAPVATAGRCLAGDRAAIAPLLLWGDSHAMAWVPVFDQLGRKQGVSVRIASHSACPPLLDVTNPFDLFCRQYSDEVYAYIKANHPSQIYLVAFWPAYSAPSGEYVLHDDAGHEGNMATFPPALRHTIAAIRPYTGRIILIGPTPGAPGGLHLSGDLPFRMALARWTASPPMGPKPLGPIQERTQWFWRAARALDGGRQLTLIDPVPWFCDGKTCRFQDERGALLYRDTNHLSVAGARFVASRFPAELLMSQLRPGGGAR